MSRPVSIWEGLFYYPGTSDDLTRWILDTPVSRTQNPRQITLYTLVVFRPPAGAGTDEYDTTEDLDGIDIPDHQGETVGLQLNTFTVHPGYAKLENGHRVPRMNVFPGCVIYLDPKIWTVEPHLPLVEINELLVFVPHDEKDYGIKKLGSNANVEAFRKMTENLAKMAMEAAFADDGDS